MRIIRAIALPALAMFLVGGASGMPSAGAAATGDMGVLCSPRTHLDDAHLSSPVFPWPCGSGFVAEA